VEKGARTLLAGCGIGGTNVSSFPLNGIQKDQRMSVSARHSRLRGPIGFVAAIAFAATALAPIGAAAQVTEATEDGEPMIVNVVPEPSQTEWTKVCGTDPATDSQICYTTRDFVSEQGQPVLAVAVYDITGAPADSPSKIVRLLMPLGLLLQPGVRFAADQNRATNGTFAICFPNGCFAEAPVTDEIVTQFKRGNTLNVSVQNQIGQVVNFAVPLAGFTAGFEGDPIDPQELEDQQRRLQEELQRRSDELRQRLEEQAGGGAAPAQQ
jgi:invasion protein IalB